MKKEPPDIFLQRMFLYQPWEIVGSIFGYFAEVLKDAPEEKIDELFIHFEKGVRDCLKTLKRNGAYAILNPDTELKE